MANNNNASTTYVLLCGHLIDGISDQSNKDVAVQIDNENIITISTKEQIINDLNQKQTKYEILDLSEYTILPGLIDCHTHPLIWLDETDDYQINHLRHSSAYKALKGMKKCEGLLQNGWTSIRICGDADVHYAHIDIKKAINEGLFDGPRIAAAGHYLSITAGGGDMSQLAPECCVHPDGKIVDGVEQMRKTVREEIKYGSDWIKLLVTGAFMSAKDDPNLVHFTKEELQVAVEEANRLGRHVCAHAHATEGIKQAIRAGCRSIEHGSFIDAEGIAMMKERGTFLVPTIFIGEYVEKYMSSKSGALDKMLTIKQETDAKFQNCIRNAIKEGVKVAVGTDYCGWDPSLNWKEIEWLAALGMSNMQAIQAATSVGAELLGWSHVGSIAVGKCADIIAVKGNPLESLETLGNVKFVMKNGKIVKPLSS